ncbi:MAG: hypothetical protein K2H09_04235 [Treponemataceae bacterium]|nr:hypothetical protein [Treponemataceae bacterium]
MLASDHIIEPAGQFAADAEKAFQSAEKGRFVCFGIQPGEPSTGYGYIQAGAPADDGSGVRKIDSFKEKPDAKTAESYLKAGNCLWNSGMFAFSCGFFISEMKACTPEIADAFEALPSGSAPQFGSIRGIPCVAGWPEMDDAYAKTPSLAIDVAVAEKTRHAYVVPASFSWDDVGSWDSFEKHSSGEGDAALIECADDFVYSDIPVAICGVSGISVIIKNGKALIMKKGASPLVRSAASYFSGKN